MSHCTTIAGGFGVPGAAEDTRRLSFATRVAHGAPGRDDNENVRAAFVFARPARLFSTAARRGQTSIFGSVRNDFTLRLIVLSRRTSSAKTLSIAAEKRKPSCPTRFRIHGKIRLRVRVVFGDYRRPSGLISRLFLSDFGFK